MGGREGDGNVEEKRQEKGGRGNDIMRTKAGLRPLNINKCLF